MQAPVPAATRLRSPAQPFPDFLFLLQFFGLIAIAALISTPRAVASQQSSAQKNSAARKKLSKPRQLDAGVIWQRDPATGELFAPAADTGNGNAPTKGSPAPAIRVTSRIVPVTCSVFNSDGTSISGLKRSDFRIYEDGIEQQIAYFATGTEPASVALVIDASPSVLRDSDEMKRAALALVDGLAPADQVAVVDFSAHTYLQADFSSDRKLVRTGIDRVDVRQLLGDVGGSNIYQAVYLTAVKVFLGSREGRKAIVLLTDGEDSGLGLTLDPATAAPRPLASLPGPLSPGAPNASLPFVPSGEPITVPLTSSPPSVIASRGAPSTGIAAPPEAQQRSVEVS